MPVTIKIDLRDLRRRIIASQKEFARSVPKTFGKDINDEIQAGKSPVKGKARFSRYKPSYTQAIKKKRLPEKNKRIRPVNLTLSGDMLKTQRIRQTGRKVNVKYTSPIAVFHNEGTPNMDRRAILPDGREEFSRTLTNKLVRQAQKAVDKKLIRR